MEQRWVVVLLILVAGLVPYVWGWIVYRLISKLWPEDRTTSPKRADISSPPPLDYQI